MREKLARSENFQDNYRRPPDLGGTNDTPNPVALTSCAILWPGKWI